LRFRQLEVDPVDPPSIPEYLLGRCDIGQDRRFLLDFRAAVRNPADHTHGDLATRNHQRQWRVAIDAELGRERIRQEHRTGLGEQPRELEIGPGRETRERPRAGLQKVKPEQWHAQPGSAGNADVSLDGRSGGRDPMAKHELAIDVFVERAVEWDEPMGDLPPYSCGRHVERAGSGVVRQAHAHMDADTEADT
jgi:hypothetical protein